MRRNGKVCFPIFESEIAKKGLTKTEVATKIGLSYNTFAGKLNGYHEFRLSEVLEICKLFSDIPVNVLFKKEV